MTASQLDADGRLRHLLTLEGLPREHLLQLLDRAGQIRDAAVGRVGNKRGVLLQLCLARLRCLSPGARTWGLSATLGNLDQARAVLLPHAPDSALVAGARPRKIQISTLLPERSRALPWAGHLGLSQLERVFKRLFDVRATLLFTNTRAQAELWHRALESIWPEAPGTLALHHGSLDPKLRAAVELAKLGR